MEHNQNHEFLYKNPLANTVVHAIIKRVKCDMGSKKLGGCTVDRKKRLTFQNVFLHECKFERDS